MNKKLIKAVKNQLGNNEQEILDTLQDVVNHGADGGFSGFICYVNTVAFYEKNKKEIIKLVEELARDLGEDVLSMINNFNCIKGNYTSAEIGKVLYGRKDCKSDAYITIANALAWLALEEVAHYEIKKEKEKYA